jgi:hypothetical protein
LSLLNYFMKKILALTVLVLSVTFASAQDTTAPRRKATVDLSNRANDHLLFQIGSTNWAGIPDTINTKGLSKSFNVYFMFDFPFKTNPHLSMAIGAGIGSDHILFTKTRVGIKDLTPTFQFTNVSDTDHFKKTKLATVYLEAPVEFRFTGNPETGKGFKAAMGVKVGTMINAHTRNAKLQNSSGNLINEFTMKESSKRFFNKNRLVVMARAGYGNFTLYGSYQVTPLLKDGSGPEVRPYSIGLTLSGL